MRIWAYDPGAVFTGLAYLNWYGQDEFSSNDMMWWQATDVVELYDTMLEYDPSWRDVILVEDFSHGGAFTLEAKKTLEIVGFLARQIPRDDLTMLRRYKDKRLSGQTEAARLMGSTVSALKKDVARKDAFSALAHAVTYTREVRPA